MRRAKLQASMFGSSASHSAEQPSNSASSGGLNSDLESATPDVAISRGPAEAFALEPSRRWLWLCLGLHFVLAGIYLVLLPLWGAVPDEPLHYSHIKFVGEFWRIPWITDPRAFGEQLWVYCFTADPVGTAQHGPVYYWSAAPLFWLSRGLSVENQQYLLRGWSLLLGAAMLVPLWKTLKLVFPRDPALVVAGTLAVTLLPHRLLMSAVIYNDIACGLTLTLAFWAVARACTTPDAKTALKAWAWAGVALGVAALTKRVALVAIPGFVLALWLQNRRMGWKTESLVRNFGVWLVSFMAVSGWWFVRDVWLYNEVFPTEPSFNRGTWMQFFVQVPPEQQRWMVWYTLRGLWLSIWSQVGWLPLSTVSPDPSLKIPAGLVAFSQFVHGGLLLATAFMAVGLLAYWSKKELKRSFTRDWSWVGLLVILGMIYGSFKWVLLTSFHGNEETGKHAIAICAATVALFGLASRQLLGERKGVLGLMSLAGLLALYNVGALYWLSSTLVPKYRPARPALASTKVADLPSGRAPGIWHRYRVPGVEQMNGRVPRPANAQPPLNFRVFPPEEMP